MNSNEQCVDGWFAGASPDPSAAGSGPPQGSVRRPRILIVDDEPMIGTTLRVLLSEEHDVVFADSGAAACQELAGNGFDLILCDLMMPGISGMDLHRWIGENAPDAAERMVFMTGGVFTDDARDFLERVPNRRIEKPFDTRDLLRLIDEGLRAAEGA